MDRALRDSSDQLTRARHRDSRSWLVFLDSDGVGTALADQLRRSGHRVRAVLHQPVDALTKIDGGYALNPQRPEQLQPVAPNAAQSEGDLAGIIDCWPLDIAPIRWPARGWSGEMNHYLGVFTILHLVKAFADHDAIAPRLYVITANAQPAPDRRLAVEQAAVWGLGRVVGHQEFVNRWGGLIDIDDADDHAETAAHLRAHSR